MDKLKLLKGQNVILELEDECFIGTIHHVSKDKTFIELYDIKDFQTNEQIEGTQIYYKSEIRNIKVLEDHSDDTAPENENEAASVSKINLEDLGAITERINNHIYISQTDAKYHSALKHLKTQSVLGINMEQIRKGRHSHFPSLLSIATRDQVYVFDVKWIGVTNEMKKILGNPYTRKIVHNSRILGDIMKHQFEVDIRNVFDTLVAHVATTSNQLNKKEISLEECISSYLNLPENFMDIETNFEERPLSAADKFQAARNVGFLFTLQDYFLHEIMLKPFYSCCEKYAQSLASDSDAIDTIIKVTSGRNDGLEEIENFELNI